MKILLLLIPIYFQYARVLDMDLAASGTKLREAFNPKNPLEILYTKLKYWVDYATAASKSIT